MRTLVYVFAAFAEVPRANCDTHGIHQVALPWAEAGGRFTALFETLVIDWLHEASVSAVCRELKLSWDQVAHIQQRAVLGLCLVQWCRTPRAHRVWCRWRRHN